ncbi:hypothetical protein As57867_006262, partial [Aphanomyces stellatus]
MQDSSSQRLEIASPHHQVPEGTPVKGHRSFLDGNFTFWWLFGGVLALWFVLYKGLGVLFGLLPPPTLTQPVRPIFALHLVTAALITLICVYNIFHTPSHGRTYRTVHIVLGRMAMISGFISFSFGAVAVWWERYNGDLPFAIGITVGGVLQVGAQLYGWYQIRKHKDVTKHKRAMLLVFFYGCLIPMWMRFVVLVAGPYKNEPWIYPVAVAFGLIVG